MMPSAGRDGWLGGFFCLIESTFKKLRDKKCVPQIKKARYPHG